MIETRQEQIDRRKMRGDRTVASPAGPIIAGKTYVVPCIRATRSEKKVPEGIPKWWPVLGTWHEDIEHIEFEWYHWHIDWRFVSSKQIAKLEEPEDIVGQVLTRSVICPLWEERDDDDDPESLPEGPRSRWLRYMKRKCHSTQRPRWGHDTYDARWGWYIELRDEYCKRTLTGKNGRICPHKGADLSSIEPDERGVIECPLHGLLWRADTGELFVD